MFNIGDKIVYGSEGVFTVQEYTASPFDKNDERLFYVLIPVNGSQNNKIIAPVEGGRIPVRYVMSRDDALALIDKIPEIEEVTVTQERGRRDAYRAVISEGRGESFVSIIKTVRRRREELLVLKRRLAETDTDFEGRAKNCLFVELSVALDSPRSDVEKFIADRLKQ